MTFAYAQARRPVDIQVDDDHDDQRDVERADGRVDSVAPVLADDALARLFRIVLRILPAEQRRDRDDGRDAPAEPDHQHDHPDWPVMDVVGPGDRPVSVDRDGHQVEYGGGAAEHVERDPHVADLLTQKPLRADFLDGRHRHDEDGDE